MRLTFVVLLYVDAAKTTAFDEYENRAYRVLLRHGGCLEKRIRCAGGSDPHEIHIVSFADETAFAAYRADPEYVALAGARAEAIRETRIIAGTELPPFGTPAAS